MRRHRIPPEWRAMRHTELTRQISRVPRGAAFLWAVAAVRSVLHLFDRETGGDTRAREAVETAEALLRVERERDWRRACDAAWEASKAALVYCYDSDDAMRLPGRRRVRLNVAAYFAANAASGLFAAFQWPDAVHTVVDHVVRAASCTRPAPGNRVEGAKCGYVYRTFVRCLGPDGVAFRPEWRTSTVVGVASYVAKTGDATAVPVLADALEDAGCDAGWLPAALRDPLAAPLCCPGWWVLRACVPLPASDPDGQPIT